MSRFREQKLIYKLMTVGLIAALVYFVFYVMRSVVIGFGYPREVLEPSNIALTKAFLAGKPPYTLSSLSYDIPAINYEYPFLGSLIAALIVLVTRCNPLTAHYFISVVSFLGTGVIGYVLVRRYSRTTAAPVAGFILFLMCHWRFGFISAAPDDLGLFLFILTLYLCVCPKIKHKQLICAIMTTLCFYTKQYFIFVAAGIFVYMLLYSRKDAVRFLIYTAVINAVAAIAISVFWPLYWTYTLFFLYNGTFTGIGFGFASLFEQMKYLSAIFIGMFLVLVISLVLAITKKKGNSAELVGDSKAVVADSQKVETIAEGTTREATAREATEGANEESVKETSKEASGEENEEFDCNKKSIWRKISSLGIAENDAQALFVVEIPVMLLPLIFFGRNDGAFLSYFLQLWMPSIIIVTLIQLERMISDNNKLLFDLIYGGVVAFTVLFGYLKLPMHTLTNEEVATWERAYEIISDYRQQGDIYYAPEMAYLCFENGDDAIWCGHDGEVSEVSLATLEKLPFCQNLFPYADDIIKKNIDFKNELTRRGMDLEYSLITFQDGNCMNFSNEYVDSGYFYEKLEYIVLQTGNMPYEVSFYKRADGMKPYVRNW